MTRALIAVFGGNRTDAEIATLAEDLGRRLVDAGFRVVCGGLGGVMAAVACGARSSSRWTGAEVIGLLPGWTDDEQANPWIDVGLATGMGSLRNNLIARVADAAIAIGGGAGTLSEVALAWHEGRPLACLADTGGWAERLAGERLDDRRAEPIVRLADVDAALAWLDELMPQGVWPHRESGPWWPVRVPCLHRLHVGEPVGARAIQARLGLSLERSELEARLRALGREVDAWNDARGQRRRALVTIDDGHAEWLEMLPTFSELPQLQPVLFVTARLLGGDQRALPLTALYAWCVASGLRLDELGVRGLDRAALKLLGEVAARERLAAAGIPLDPPDERLLSVAQIEQLRDAGWLVGSHGPEHCDLRALDPADVGSALLEARRALLVFGGVPWLAWPEGRCDDELRGRGRAAGFAWQFGLAEEPACVRGPELIVRSLWT